MGQSTKDVNQEIAPKPPNLGGEGAAGTPNASQKLKKVKKPVEEKPTSKDHATKLQEHRDRMTWPDFCTCKDS